MFINYATPKKYLSVTLSTYVIIVSKIPTNLVSILWAVWKPFSPLSASSLPEAKLLTPGTRFVHLKLSNGRMSPLPFLSSAVHLQIHTVPRWWEHLSRRWQEDLVLLGTDTTKQSQSWLYLNFPLSQFRKKRSQISDSHANKINRHGNEMCSGRGSVYIGRKSTETYNSMFLFFPPSPSFVPFNPKELFLKARVPGFDHNVRAEGERALTFLSSACTISKLQTAGPRVWASITPIMWVLWGLLFPPHGQTF